MEYSIDDLVMINTSDNETILSFMSLLLSRYQLFEDYFEENKDVEEVDVDLSADSLRLLFRFFDFNEIPSTVADWVTILEVADYLQLKGEWQRKLTRQAREAFSNFYEPKTGFDFIYYDGPMLNTNVSLRDAYAAFVALM
jgi:hypothetical protein